MVSKILCVYIVPLYEQFKDNVKTFFETYKNFNAGIEHDLLIVYKHDNMSKYFPLNTSELSSIVDYDLTSVDHCSCFHDNTGKDIGTYVRIAKDYMYSNYDIIVFMSTSTKILVGEWLIKMINCFNCKNIGIVGAHGSYDGGMYRYTAKHNFNPHIRTNCFAVPKKYLYLMKDYSINNDTDRCNFEHGPSSITIKILELGLKPVVVNQDGVMINWPDWHLNRGWRKIDNNIVIDRHGAYPDGDGYLGSYPIVPESEWRDIFKTSLKVLSDESKNNMSSDNKSTSIQNLISSKSATDNIYGTDKDTLHSYGPIYERLFTDDNRQVRVKSILEIGVFSGAFTDVLATYFYKAHVDGIDINLSTIKFGKDNKRISYYQLDGNDSSTVEFLKLKHSGYDIIIEDASHHPDHQIRIAELFLPMMNPSGLYIVEDIADVNSARIRTEFECIASKSEGKYVLEWCDLRHIKNRSDDIMAIFHIN